MSLAEERRARRAGIKSKIDEAARKKREAKRFAADIKAAYAKDAARNKKKSVTDRITRLGNNPNAKIKGTTLISYMANNTPAQALRDLGILTPKVEKALTRKGPAPKKSEKKKTPMQLGRSDRQLVKAAFLTTAPKAKTKTTETKKTSKDAPKKETARKKDKFAGEPRTIAQAKRMGKSYFINKAGKKLAAVTREDLKRKGLDPNKKSDLTKFLNMKRKK
tara:strand:+ start:41 stop:700 length:660 start_codon:yes stop_codon:yes gene_type:complete